MKLWEEKDGKVVPTGLNRALRVLVFLAVCVAVCVIVLLSRANGVAKLVAVLLVGIAAAVGTADILQNCR